MASLSVPAPRPVFGHGTGQGTPITRSCDEHKLDTTQRLELFVKVCQAIHHAHQKEIIHRDIKPSNIQRAPPKLVGLIRGDLDWIVMKTLEKDRNRRYETATGLAADISRFLYNEPILARPPSTLYRFGKLVRRSSIRPPWRSSHWRF
jgi:hypothetical protein